MAFGNIWLKCSHSLQYRCIQQELHNTCTIQLATPQMRHQGIPKSYLVAHETTNISNQTLEMESGQRRVEKSYSQLHPPLACHRQTNYMQQFLARKVLSERTLWLSTMFINPLPRDLLSSRSLLQIDLSLSPLSLPQQQKRRCYTSTAGWTDSEAS